MHYDQKCGQLALRGLWFEIAAAVGVGCQKVLRPKAQHYVCKPTAAGLPTPLAPCTRVDGGEELLRTCCLALG